MAAAEPIKDIEKIREMKKIIKEGQNSFRNLLIFEIGLATALRIGDILDLKKKDIQSGVVRVKTKKTGVYKNIELNRRVWSMVEAHIQDLEEDDYIFDIKYGQVYKTLKRAAKKANLVNISAHTLRKTASWHFYYECGKDLRKTMYLLGHKEPRETIGYLNLSDEEVNITLREMDLD